MVFHKVFLEKVTLNIGVGESGAALEAAKTLLKNVSVGIKEYIDFPGLKYDPKIGMMGFDVCLSLRKKGLRVSQRRIAKKKLPRKQRVSSAEAREFLEKTYGVNVASAA